MQYLDAISKTRNDLCWFSGKPFNIMVIQVYALTSNAKKLKLTVLWRPTRPSRTNTQNRCPFHYRGLECKSSKSRDTWSNRQMWPWSTKWSRAKANRVLPRGCTGHSKHPLPTTQEKSLQMESPPDGQHQNQIDYMLFSQRWKSSISQQKQDLELTVAQIINSLLPNSDLNWRK